MLESVRDLYDLGFAVHCLKPKSKQPIDHGWSRGDRKKWDALSRQYKDGMNLGVRLGPASKFPDGTILAVIDCDVKSGDPKHRLEMERELARIIPDRQCAVISGRGNGSKHVYVRIAEPRAGVLLKRSPEKVKVPMPSMKPTQREKEQLRDDEIRAGMRIRPAWEISFMCAGAQVVLPPSVHPDSGAAYRWHNEPKSVSDIPVFDAGGIVAEKKPAGDFKFVPEDVCLDLLDLSDRIRELIQDGAGTGERSEAIAAVIPALMKAGCSDQEIMSVMTDTGNGISEKALENRGGDRVSAAQWIHSQLPKFRDWVSGRSDFDGIEPLGASERAEIAEESTTAEGAKLDTTGTGKIKVTLKNVLLILREKISPVIFKYDAFAGRDVYGVVPPWEDFRTRLNPATGRTETDMAGIGSEINDRSVVGMLAWFAETQKIEPPKQMLHDAVIEIARRNSFHPVRDYLNALEWDGVDRLERWTETYLGAYGPEPYFTEVNVRVLCQMIERVMYPGCHLDYVVVFEGAQGIGKTTAAKILASPWFSNTPFDIRNKDSVIGLQGTWLLELAELASVVNQNQNLVKAFLTTQSDRIRLPYGRMAQTLPRQNVFFGTTNDDDYLRDDTGGRRYWPIEMTQLCKTELERDRDQLFAEAMFYWSILGVTGEGLKLSPKADACATREQKMREPENPVTDVVRAFISKQDENAPIRVSEFFMETGPFNIREVSNKSLVRKIRKALKDLGLFEKQIRVSGGSKTHETVFLRRKNDPRFLRNGNTK